MRRLYCGHLANMITGKPATNTTLINDDVKRPGQNQIQVVVRFTLLNQNITDGYLKKLHVVGKILRELTVSGNQSL
ncbi:hypothetical protein D3C81_1105810 [compost metagenome]